MQKNTLKSIFLSLIIILSLIHIYRSKIGKLAVKNIEIGKWRYLTQSEISSFNTNLIK